MKKQEILNVLKSELSKKQYDAIAKKNLSDVVKKYHAILVSKLAPELGLDESVLNSFSVDRLNELAETLTTEKTEVAKDVTYSRGPGKRQAAVLTAATWLSFPVDRKVYLNAVRAAYAPNYFDMNGAVPKNFAAVKTLAKSGLITPLNDVNVKDAIKDLKKQGYYSAVNACKPVIDANGKAINKTAISSHNRPDIFPFVLTIESGMVTKTERPESK